MDPKTWEEFTRLLAEIQASPGEKVQQEIQQMQGSLRIVGRNQDELVRTIKAFTAPEVIPQLWEITRRTTLDAATEEVTRTLFNFVTSALSLVDHMRHHKTNLYGASEFSSEIDSEIASRFKTDDDHLIAQGFRNVALHVRPVPINAILTGGPAGRGLSSAFEVPVDELLEWDEWTGGQRAALSRIGDSLDLLSFSERYFQKLLAFYEWLWQRQAEIHYDAIEATNQLRDKASTIYDNG